MPPPIEQVDGELHQDARSIGRSCAGGELGVILECQRKGVVRCGTQQAESKERHAAQNLEHKRGRRELNLGQAHDDDRDGGGVDGCQRVAFALCEPEQRRISDKADHAGAEDEALRNHNTLGTGEQPTLMSNRNSAARKTKAKSASAKSALILGLLRFKDSPLGGRNSRVLDCSVPGTRVTTTKSY